MLISKTSSLQRQPSLFSRSQAHSELHSRLRDKTVERRYQKDNFFGTVTPHWQTQFVVSWSQNGAVFTHKVLLEASVGVFCKFLTYVVQILWHCPYLDKILISNYSSLKYLHIHVLFMSTLQLLGRNLHFLSVMGCIHFHRNGSSKELQAQLLGSWCSSFRR